MEERGKCHWRGKGQSGDFLENRNALKKRSVSCNCRVAETLAELLMRALMTKLRYTTVIPAFAGIQNVLVSANSGFRHPPMADIFDFRRND